MMSPLFIADILELLLARKEECQERVLEILKRHVRTLDSLNPSTNNFAMFLPNTDIYKQSHHIV